MSFNHMRSFAPGLVAGAVVRRGQLLGLAGNTSNGKFRGMGAHLHLETRHAPADGRLTPFPGPYGRDNFDPVDWFERHGVFREGRRLVSVGTCAPRTTASSKGLGQALPKATDVPWKAIGDSKPKPPAGTEYEPPRKMAPSIGMVALTVGAGIGLIGLGMAVWRESLPIPFLSRIGLGDVGVVPEQLFSEIRSESSHARSMIMKSNCDQAYLRLANGYELLIRANRKSSSSKEDARIDRLAKGYDKLAKQIDERCSE
jgi:hypothetical protein